MGRSAKDESEKEVRQIRESQWAKDKAEVKRKKLEEDKRTNLNKYKELGERFKDED